VSRRGSTRQGADYEANLNSTPGIRAREIQEETQSAWKRRRHRGREGDEEARSMKAEDEIGRPQKIECLKQKRVA